MMTGGGASVGWCREAIPLLRPQKDVIFIALRAVLARRGRRDSRRRIMGGDPVTTKPIVLKVDEEVRDILDRAGLLSFFRKLSGFNEDISLQVVETWNDEKVTVNGLDFIITEQLIADVSGVNAETLGQGGSPNHEVSHIGMSTCLQKKSTEKSKVVDFVESTEEDIEDSNAGKSVEVGKFAKDVGLGIPNKGSAKGPDGTHNLVEDLKCHLKVPNGLSSSLTSTCACINLLTLEITNYLKEVVSNLKEMSLARN
eukprot:Gb_37073 [translate_table: standard]